MCERYSLRKSLSAPLSEHAPPPNLPRALAPASCRRGETRAPDAPKTRAYAAAESHICAPVRRVRTGICPQVKRPEILLPRTPPSVALRIKSSKALCKKRGITRAFYGIKPLLRQSSNAATVFTMSSSASSTIPLSTTAARSGRMGRRTDFGMPNSFATSSARLLPKISSALPQSGHL